jgi:flagellar hook-associated protein 3 FlgL
LGEVHDIMIRARELAAGLSGGLTTPAARQTAAVEVTELEKGLLALGNTTVAGRYVFGGLATTGPVFTSFDDPGFAPATAYTGSPTPFAVRTARDESVRLTTSGGDVFGSSLQAIDDLRQTLAAGNDPAATLTPLEGAANDVRQERASVGGRLARLQSRDQEIGTAITTAKTLLSGVEDADLTETVTQLAQVRNALEATLTAGSSLLQTTILDYLKL